jgi:hypothetical protein
MPHHIFATSASFLLSMFHSFVQFVQHGKIIRTVHMQRSLLFFFPIDLSVSLHSRWSSSPIYAAHALFSRLESQPSNTSPSPLLRRCLASPRSTTSNQSSNQWKHRLAMTSSAAVSRVPRQRLQRLEETSHVNTI